MTTTLLTLLGLAVCAWLCWPRESSGDVEAELRDE